MKIRSAEFTIGVAYPEQLPVDNLPEIAFAGRSNVGKSSLINTLTGRKTLAHTSSTPGKTRQLNYYKINNFYYFVDLPGYGYAKVHQPTKRNWSRLVNDYLETRDSLCGVVQIIDARHDPTDLDYQMIQWLARQSKPFLIVATKIDKLSRGRLVSQMPKTNELLSQVGQFEIVSFSAVTKEGTEKIWKWIEATIETRQKKQ